MTERSTLHVGSFSSTCGSCGHSADPKEVTHATLLGYGSDNGKPGCGVKWTHITSSYVYPGMAERLAKMRPDLAVVYQFG